MLYMYSRKELGIFLYSIYIRLSKNIYYFIKQGCVSGSYGFKCIENCGHCRGMNKCLHINGTCLIGCDAGYQGFLCKTRKYTFSEDGNL